MGTLPNVEITYRNILGEEIRADRFGPVYLTSYEGFGSPENEISSQKIFGKTGQRKTSSSISYRDMSIGVSLKTSSFEKLKEKERNVMKIINPQIAGTIFIRINEKLYSIDAEPLKGFDPKSSNSASTSSDTLQFRALDPEWRDEDINNKAIPLSLYDNKLKFPLAITSEFAFSTLVPGKIVEIENKGDFAVGFELTVNCTSVVTNPRVYNVITQEFFGWNGTFESGSVLYLSTVHGKKDTWYKNADESTQTNAMKLRMPGSTFFALDNVNSNHLVMQADEGVEHASATISFTPLVIGV